MKKEGKSIDVGEFYLFAQETIQSMGGEAMNFYGKGRHSPPFDQDLVTQAELHLNQTFSKLISDRYPTHQVYGQAQLGDGYTHGDTAPEGRFRYRYEVR